MQCSFCLRGQREVAHLVHGTDGAICDACAQRITRALGPSTLVLTRDRAHQLSLLPMPHDTVNGFASERALPVEPVVAAFAQYFDHWIKAESAAEQVRAALQFWQLLQTKFAANEMAHLDVAAALTTLVDHGCRTDEGA